MLRLKAMLLLLLCQVIQQVTSATTENPTTSIECPLIVCPYECFQGVDSNGCNTCNCDNTCRVTRCPEGYKCIMSPVVCEKGPCDPLPECVPNYYECPTECPADCPWGIDSNGCNISDCGDACRFTECSEGQKCVAIKLFYRSQCYPRPECVPNDYETTVSPKTSTECPMVTCPADCFMDVDSNGCNICNCDNTCHVTECPEGQKCVMIDDCFRSPCFQRPECVPNDYGTTDNPTTSTEPKTCPRRIECKAPCEADLGPDLCYSKCSCPQTCSDIKCKADEVCDLVQVYCIRAPCFPVPTCFPKNRTCSQSPNVDRCTGRRRTQWTYNSTTNACESFNYYGCTPSPNTFKSRKECEDLCVQELSCPPDTKMCMVNCYWGQRTPETCPECICPCWAVRCTANTECRLREGDCSKGEPCHPTAYCAPVTQVTCEPVCDQYCEYGHVKDANGCDTCPCNSAPTTTYA